MNMDTDTTSSDTATDSSGIDGYESKEGGQDSSEGFDYAQAFKSTSQELSATKGQLETYRQKLESVQRQAEESGAVVNRLKEAFSPDSKGEADPVSEWERQRDYYLEQALKAEKAGRPITLTTNLAVQFFEDKIKAHNDAKSNAAKVKELEDTIKTLTDPNREVDHRAAAQIDSTIVDFVERLYGNDEKTYPQRAAQYHAIASQVKTEIHRLQKEKPAAWEQVRRSEKMQKKLVEFVVEQNQPPKVRQILEQERLKNTPMSMGELKAAFEEAKQLKDPKQREKETSAIRREILSMMFEKRAQPRRGGGVGRMYG